MKYTESKPEAHVYVKDLARAIDISKVDLQTQHPELAKDKGRIPVAQRLRCETKRSKTSSLLLLSR